MTERLGRGGGPRTMGAVAGLVVGAPLAALVFVLPVLAAVVDAAMEGGIKVAVVVMASGIAGASVLGAGGLSGAIWGRRAFGRPEVMRSGSVLSMSWLAVTIGAGLLVGGLALAQMASLGWSGGPGVVLALAFVWAIGVLVFGLPALVIVVPHAIAWRSLMRRVAVGVA